MNKNDLKIIKSMLKVLDDNSLLESVMQSTMIVSDMNTDEFLKAWHIFEHKLYQAAGQ